MRVVIDSNRVQSEELKRFLASAPSHRAVVTDWLMMEAYKGDTRNSIYKSLGVLAKYPRQVIVLQNTGMCMQRRVGPQMANRLIWETHTKTFPQFIKEIEDARAGNILIEESLLWRGEKANERMQEILDNADVLMERFRAMAMALTPQDISAIRTNKSASPGILGRVFDIANGVSDGFRNQMEKPIPQEQGKRFGDDFLFRVGVSVTASFLEWVRVGSPQIIKAEKARNDYVDSMLAVFATYFNGLMSGDRKLQGIYELSRALLQIRRVSLPVAYQAPAS